MPPCCCGAPGAREMAGAGGCRARLAWRGGRQAGRRESGCGVSPPSGNYFPAQVPAPSLFPFNAGAFPSSPAARCAEPGKALDSLPPPRDTGILIGHGAEQGETLLPAGKGPAGMGNAAGAPRGGFPRPAPSPGQRCPAKLQAAKCRAAPRLQRLPPPSGPSRGGEGRGGSSGGGSLARPRSSAARSLPGHPRLSPLARSRGDLAGCVPASTGEFSRVGRGAGGPTSPSFCNAKRPFCLVVFHGGVSLPRPMQPHGGDRDPVHVHAGGSPETAAGAAPGRLLEERPYLRTHAGSHLLRNHKYSEVPSGRMDACAPLAPRTGSAGGWCGTVLSSQELPKASPSLVVVAGLGYYYYYYSFFPLDRKAKSPLCLAPTDLAIAPHTHTQNKSWERLGGEEERGCYKLGEPRRIHACSCRAGKKNNNNNKKAWCKI